MNILVTGGAGFIGSEFVRILAQDQKCKVTVIDSLTYAGNLDNLKTVKEEIVFYQADIRNSELLKELFLQSDFTKIVHFAAESHVDNSISNPNPFLDTNVGGTLNLLKLAHQFNIEEFIHVSTDEVYGSIISGFANEEYPFNPSSPYSASKASAEHFVKAWSDTYGLKSKVVRCSNNYGPRQHSEKFIPRAIGRLLNGEKIPIYGSGMNIREWIHVADCANAILSVMNSSNWSGIFNISSGEFRTNLEIAHELLQIFELDSSYLEYVEDRKGHDFRYAMDSSRIRTELGWEPRIGLSAGLKSTVDWYRNFANA